MKYNVFNVFSNVAGAVAPTVGCATRGNSAAPGTPMLPVSCAVRTVRFWIRFLRPSEFDSAARELVAEAGGSDFMALGSAARDLVVESPPVIEKVVFFGSLGRGLTRNLPRVFRPGRPREIRWQLMHLPSHPECALLRFTPFFLVQCSRRHYTTIFLPSSCCLTWRSTVAAFGGRISLGPHTHAAKNHCKIRRTIVKQLQMWPNHCKTIADVVGPLLSHCRCF